MTIAHFAVRGRVQGVGFRWFVRSTARELGVLGWVRNVNDGSVEAMAAATDDVLDRFEARLRSGPAGSEVESVSRRRAEADGALPDPFLVLK